MKRCLATALLLISAVFVVGCNNLPAMDYEKLVDGLRESGATVETEEEGIDGLREYETTVKAEGERNGLFQFPKTGNPIFSVNPKQIRVNAETVIVLEFPDEYTAEIETGRVSPGGYNFTIPSTTEKGEGEGGHINWQALPHFYQAGKIIVFYAGENQALMALLSDLLGIQFAGSGAIRSGDIIIPEHVH